MQSRSGQDNEVRHDEGDLRRLQLCRRSLHTGQLMWRKSSKNLMTCLIIL